MKQQIADIVKIKKIREESAFNEMKRREQILEQATKKVEEKEKELLDYQEWRIKEENRLYNNILKKKVYVKDIDSLKLEIIHNKEQEQDYVKARDDALQEKENAHDAYMDSKKDYSQAVINTEKTGEILTVVTEEEAFEAERTEEGEMEEQATSVSIGPREEWEN
ncbi:MAG: YscO family type III secretion system apparatus protein [Alphaproteobacteria bacterium]|jgi:hypothetical protein|nr:YscO family type III secretion system apparatus protein [Alphaproteobacteria bacterium]MBP9876766.1 YscO family type III secretion system apparatus protein [Alphaproteobacteria bacterium]